MKGLYIGAAGMMTNMQKINVRSNNIANSSTSGFKFDQMTTTPISKKTVMFQDHTGRRAIGGIEYAVRPEGTYVNLKPGSTYITGRDQDFFIHDLDPNAGASFFMTEFRGKTYLSRGGQLQVNAEGYLHTAEGAYLLDVNGAQVRVGAGTKLQVSADGRIYNAESGAFLAQLATKFVQTADKGHLIQFSGGKMQLEGTDTRALPNGQGSVQNGVLEMSNVDMGAQMVGLMEDQRMVQASSNVMAMFDKVYDKEATGLIRP
ncbi:flagellar hook-basal body complex protein [Listeria ilorinensis]|uniref:flagellar hook-basal body complex protein n=1 Tax=Listeria ilorinensis TaxID=2867439 RepID=UPI001EF619D3|nr:flagellar hook-basal body complex protein [Listeria ilorinensis]